MKECKNIALFIGMIENEFSYAICEGAMLGAKELGANLFVMPSGSVNAIYDDEEANYYRYQDNALYSCMEAVDIDAAIIEYGTVTGFLDEAQRKEFLKQFDHVPTILLYGEMEGYSSICIDNRAGLQEAIEHFIEAHHCTRIGFVSGPLSNKDAAERLEVYRNTMEKHGLSYEEDWIAYGDFSEYCDGIIERYILEHPDMEAIAFANDSMAVGGYRAMEKLHLVPGKDILVSGFDDTAAAMMLEPNLTTVKGDTKELAYRAVMECAHIGSGEKIRKQIPSKLVVRESCGCSNTAVVNRTIADIRDLADTKRIRQLADEMYERYFNVFFNSRETQQMKEEMQDFFVYYFGLAGTKGELCLDKKEFLRQFERYAEAYMTGYVGLSQLFSIAHMLYECVRNVLVKEEDRLCLSEMMNEAEQRLVVSITRNKMAADEKDKLFKIQLAATTRDMLQYSGKESKKFNSVIRKFQYMKFASCYIYAYETGIHHLRDEKWHMPKHLYMKAYYDRDNVFLYGGQGKKIKSRDMFSARFMPKDRRFDMIVMPVYCGEEQYGIILAESNLQYFRYAVQMACQVGVSIDVIEIIKRQNEIKEQLQKNLEQIEANNRILDEISRKDPLTELYNRRGFVSMVKQITDNPLNHGKCAVAVYADMDGLKVVNDDFGHEEGDFALKSIARILKEAFRDSDVVGRMGGDEFAAFAMVSQKSFANILKERIRLAAKAFNEQCDKPYYVNMSVGTHEFVVNEEINLEHILNLADEDLYLEKKSKTKVIYKQKEEPCKAAPGGRQEKTAGRAAPGQGN